MTTITADNGIQFVTFSTRVSLFGRHADYQSVRFNDNTGSVQRNFDSLEMAQAAIAKFFNNGVEYADTNEFYLSYNICRWFQLNF